MDFIRRLTLGICVTIVYWSHQALPGSLQRRLALFYFIRGWWKMYEWQGEFGARCFGRGLPPLEEDHLWRPQRAENGHMTRDEIE